MPSTVKISLTEEEIDDILFYSRTGQLEEFLKCIKELSSAADCTPQEIIASSVEEQSENMPLHMAAANDQLDILNHVTGLLSMTSTQSKSSLLDAQNAWGNTPLHWAALNGHLESVKALAAGGALLGIKNKAGHDAVYEAEMNSKNAVVEWLLQQGQVFESGSEEVLEPISSNDGKAAKEPNDEPELVVKIKNMALQPSP